MATKGASNHYGNSKGGKQGEKSKYIGYAWAKDFNIKTLDIHMNEHGKQMGCTTKNEYVAKAIHFANYVDKANNVSFLDKNESTYKYNKKTNEFAIITKKGYVVTYYKPKEGYKYYLNQKTKLIKRRKKI